MFNLKAGVLRQRIIDIFGKRLNQDLLSVNVDTSMCKISGYVGKPESARKKGAHQYFFVNGRYMKHPYFSKAVMNAFDRLVPMGEQVPYFIYFDINTEDIDVNIHPTKTEIKFENEQTIWQILSAAVKDAVGMFNEVSAIDFDTEGKPDIPLFNSDSEAPIPEVQYNPQYNPFASTGHSGGTDLTFGRKEEHGHPAEELIFHSKAPEQWEQLYSQLEPEPDITQGSLFRESKLGSEETLIADKSPMHYQYKGKYIMTAVKSGLMIIDQHRAHVRILFEQYLRQLKDRTFHSQKVLFPEVVQFPMSEKVIFEKILPEMNGMGFELEDLGGGSYAVNSVPAGLEGMNPVRLVQDMVSSAVEKGVSAMDEINQALALSLARQAAIPHGQVLSNEEMEGLVNGLFACENVNYTPDGKSVLCILQQQEIEHLLG